MKSEHPQATDAPPQAEPKVGRDRVSQQKLATSLVQVEKTGARGESTKRSTVDEVPRALGLSATNHKAIVSLELSVNSQASALSTMRSGVDEVDAPSSGDTDNERPLLDRRRHSRRAVAESAAKDSTDSDEPMRTYQRPTRSAHPRATRQRRRSVSAEDAEPAPAAVAAGVVTRKITQSTKVDDTFAFRVDVVLPGTTLVLEPDFERLRVCSLATGRVVVKVESEAAFAIGHQGMFQLVPGAGAHVVNSAAFDAVLQISSYKHRM